MIPERRLKTTGVVKTKKMINMQANLKEYELCTTIIFYWL